MCNPKSLVSHFDFSGAHYDMNEIAGVLRDDKDLLAAWAHNCDIDVTDERCVYGWPEKFWYFYNGWYCANHREEFLTGAQQPLCEKSAFTEEVLRKFVLEYGVPQDFDNEDAITMLLIFVGRFIAKR